MTKHPKPSDFVPEPDFPPGHYHHGKPRCQAWNDNAGRQCLGIAMTGKRVCKNDGGKSLAGIASPQFRNGRYSKYLPERLLERYKEAAADPDLLALRHDIALTDTRLADLLKRVDTGEAGQIWRDARKTLQDFKEAQRAAASDPKKIDEMREQLYILEDLIERGASDYQAWHEIGQIMEQKRRLVESERKRLVEMQQMITVERQMILLSAVVSTIRKHVTDRKILSAISTDIGQLVSANAIREVEA